MKYESWQNWAAVGAINTSSRTTVAVWAIEHAGKPYVKIESFVKVQHPEEGWIPKSRIVVPIADVPRLQELLGEAAAETAELAGVLQEGPVIAPGADF